MATQPSVFPRYRPYGQPAGYAPDAAATALQPVADQPDDPEVQPSTEDGGPWSPTTGPEGVPNSIYGQVGAAPGGEYGANATTAAGTNVPAVNTNNQSSKISGMFGEDKATNFAQNQQIINEAKSQLGYYGPLQSQYQQQQDKALSQLQQTPGYTAEEQGTIAGNPQQGVDITNSGVGNEEAALGQYKSGVDTGVANLKSGLNTAQGGFSKLDSAVNNPALAFDPNSTEQQLSDADVQEMKTAAGTRVGNQYRTAEDQLRRGAAAAGNSSPLAIAAANARLQAQSAAGQGDAEVTADIAARQAQQERAAQIEQQREGATQTQAGMKAQAATTEQGQAQNAATIAGQAGINAAQTTGAAGLNQQNTETGQRYNAATTADTAASQRAADAAQQRITGQGAYRSGVAQQQGLAQQGGQTAVTQQQNAANTQGGLLNSSTAAAANYGVGQASDSAIHQATGLVGAILKKGGVVTEPTVGVVGEAGPELVVPMPRYRQGERMAA